MKFNQIERGMRLHNHVAGDYCTVTSVGAHHFIVKYDATSCHTHYDEADAVFFVNVAVIGAIDAGDDGMQHVSLSRLNSFAVVAKAVANDDINPKDKIGRKKVAMELVPPSAKAHMAHAFMDGATKYGAYNWREKKVSAMVYIGAMMRHIDAYLDGEDTAADSGAHHLGHAQACCGILLDAAATGNLIDDRPTKGNAATLHAELHALIVARS